ncbi:LytR/AlgR family response regulator transcription factor [Anaerocolumna jejuensis]|uniref:LytR/AlgR family response regulator transcription factor n=1 Tax=Anaerocolumna jejuensis TaxID=259063 RepID=UPI003F7BAF63
MKIVLCDDDDKFVIMLKNKISTYLVQCKIKHDIQIFCSGEELLQSNINQVDIIFLDIKLAKMNGIEIATTLRRRNPSFVLIFISGVLEYAPAGYEVRALRYVLKDQLNELFMSTMEAILKEMGYFRTEISFEFVNGEKRVYTDDIIYLESDLHITRFYFTGNVKDRYLYETLNIIEKRLPDNEFLRIHQSYLVNIKYFLDVRKYRANLINGIELPISQKNFSYVKKRLFLFRGRI